MSRYFRFDFLADRQVTLDRLSLQRLSQVWTAWPCRLLQENPKAPHWASSGKFIVSKAVAGYDARDRDPSENSGLVRFVPNPNI